MPGVAANQICATEDSLAPVLRISAVVDTLAGTVPYLVIREILPTPAGYARLQRDWGPPDTVVATGSRWQRGPWVADADTAASILTVWLSDSATASRITRAMVAAARQASGADTLPVVNDAAAITDTLLAARAGEEAAVPVARLAGKPALIRCDNVSPPADLARMGGAVVLSYVVDTSGHVEPGLIRVVEATRAGLIEAAVRTVASCVLRPGRDAKGQAVRTLVQQRVRFTAAPAEKGSAKPAP